MRNHTVIVAALITSLMPLALKAQGTIADYRRAAAVNDQLTGLTVNVAQQPTWLGSTRFWYRKSVKGGNQFLLVDASTGQKRAPFDHALLAAALTSVARPDSAYTAVRLPFQTFTLVNDDLGVEVNANNSRWRCTLTDYACTRIGEANAPDFQGGGGRGGAAGGAGGFGTAPTPSTACVPPSGPGGRAAGSGRAGGGAATNQVTSCISPDGKTEAFIQNYNVALRPARSSAPNATTDATMLSFDGSEGDGYELMSIRWAPDSKLSLSGRGPLERSHYGIQIVLTDELCRHSAQRSDLRSVTVPHSLSADIDSRDEFAEHPPRYEPIKPSSPSTCRTICPTLYNHPVDESSPRQPRHTGHPRL